MFRVKSHKLVCLIAGSLGFTLSCLDLIGTLYCIFTNIAVQQKELTLFSHVSFIVKVKKLLTSQLGLEKHKNTIDSQYVYMPI